MSVFIEIIVAAVLSVFVSTGEVKKDKLPEMVKLEQISEISVPVKC